MKASKKLIHVQRSDRRLSMIARHYGLWPQLKKCCEELFELYVAIIVLRVMNFIGRTKPKHYEHVYEELSDVRIMLDQIELLTGSAARCREIRESKLERQLTRIETEAK